MNLKSQKKKFLSIILITLLGFVSTNVHGQEARFGLKGGLNLSSMTVEGADDSNLLPGFHAGAFARVMATDLIGLQPEVLFSTRGYKAVYNESFLGYPVADGTTKLNLDYIDVPLHVVFSIAEDFNFHVGPYFGFLVNADAVTDAEVLDFINVDDVSEIDREEFNTVDMGVSGGLGFTFDPVTVGFNYSLGLNRVAKESEAMDALIGDAKNNNIQVYVGFLF